MSRYSPLLDIYLTIRERARVVYEQIVNEAQLELTITHGQRVQVI